MRSLLDIQEICIIIVKIGRFRGFCQNLGDFRQIEKLGSSPPMPTDRRPKWWLIAVKVNYPFILFFSTWVGKANIICIMTTRCKTNWSFTSSGRENLKCKYKLTTGRIWTGVYNCTSKTNETPKRWK